MVVIEDGHRPTTQFYGLVQLHTDQSALAQFNALKERFVKDKVWTKIKSNMVALVVDGKQRNFLNFRISLELRLMNAYLLVSTVLLTLVLQEPQ